MHVEIAKLWTKALRSGKYNQGRHLLRRASTFDALGILCEIHRQEIGGAWVSADKPGTFGYLPGGQRETRLKDIETHCLPAEVAVWAGLHEPNPTFPSRVPTGGVTRSIAGLNDGGASFRAIAFMIERYTIEL